MCQTRCCCPLPDGAASIGSSAVSFLQQYHHCYSDITTAILHIFQDTDGICDPAMLAEDMLAAIANAIGLPVGLAVQRLETVSAAGLPMELFTTDMSSTCIRSAAAARMGGVPVLQDVYIY